MSFWRPLDAVVRGNVVDGAVQAGVVVVVDEAGDDLAGLFEGGRRVEADGAALDGLVVTLNRATADLEFSTSNANPGDKAGGGDLRALRPSAHEVDDGVAGVMGHPALGQFPPNFF